MTANRTESVTGKLTGEQGARKRAWKTRRKKYGPSGHRGSYSRGECSHCGAMRMTLVRLHVEGVLSEGQAAKATGLGRIQLRCAADDFVNQREARRENTVDR